jgi:hypothetical protein
VQCVGCGVLGSWLKAQGVGFRVEGLRIRVWDLGHWVWGLELRVQGVGFWGLGLMVQGVEVWGSGFGCRVWGDLIPHGESAAGWGGVFDRDRHLMVAGTSATDF